MPYAEKTKKVIADAPKTLGNEVGRWASYLDFSVFRIARATGATRQTVYNWFSGGDVTPAYRDRVSMLLKILQTHKTAEDAWRATCRTFGIRN